MLEEIGGDPRGLVGVSPAPTADEKCRPGYYLCDIVRVYKGSSGDATLALYKQLEAMGTVGVVAVNLFRACKASERAKAYRGRQNIVTAYGKKEWSLAHLADALHELEARSGAIHTLGLGGTAPEIPWGWGVDPAQPVYKHVLYVDLPLGGDGRPSSDGQVSFHTRERGLGPDYPPGKFWDGRRGVGPDRICRWVARLFAEQYKRERAA